MKKDIEILEGLIKTPFAYHGREPGKGLDCFGLGLIIDKRLGLGTFDFGSPGEKNSFDLIGKSISNNKSLFVKLDKPEKWCWVTFIMRKRLVTHVGKVINWPYFIHVLEDTQVTVERLDGDFWKNHIEGYYKWKTQE